MAGKFYIAAYGTIGGVRTNKKGEVLDADLNPIPGLYSAGSDCNTIYGDSYNFTLPGNTMGFAINSGPHGRRGCGRLCERVNLHPVRSLICT